MQQIFHYYQYLLQYLMQIYYQNSLTFDLVADGKGPQKFEQQILKATVQNHHSQTLQITEQMLAKFH